MKNDPSTTRIQGYHAHVYYDPATRPVVQQLARQLWGRFPVEITGFFDRPAGPHPRANLHVSFATAEFGAVVPWLMQNRNGLDVLVHVLTEDPVRDHHADALWLGTPLPLRMHGHRASARPELRQSA
ncbi:MAG TPA: DOPA 4,5-dioxygenase family protein [Stellaceae bacterium]|nr:DOPA 4,5-dioxygenase family protein [Stellaceae bacterium]